MFKNKNKTGHFTCYKNRTSSLATNRNLCGVAPRYNFVRCDTRGVDSIRLKFVGIPLLSVVTRLIYAQDLLEYSMKPIAFV
jgi:hypothetical protein